VLTLHYIPEDEWHGELRVEARHAGFSGRASAWFNADALRQFVAPLHRWPPELKEPVKLQGGYFSDSTTSSAPIETHIGIAIVQRGSRGRYSVEAHLTEPDDEILPQSTTVRFLVEPAALLRFAGEVDAILECGGTVTLPASDSNDPCPDIMRAPCAIERPYTLLFMVLREECSALIERMDKEVVEQIHLANGQDAAISWQSSPRREIMAKVAWDKACLDLSWVEWNGEAWAVGDPVGADWSPTYPLDLSALKQAAVSTPHPRAWFESYAFYILSTAQDYLIEFFRDGPTDDIPYQRHLIYAHGTARNSKPVWVKHVLFKYDDRQEPGGTA
jgi:hypothetical protein